MGGRAAGGRPHAPGPSGPSGRGPGAANKRGAAVVAGARLFGAARGRGAWQTNGFRYTVQVGNEGREGEGLNYYRLKEALEGDEAYRAERLLEAPAPPPAWVANNPLMRAHWDAVRPAEAALADAEVAPLLAKAFAETAQGLEPRPRQQGSPDWEYVPCPVPNVEPGTFRTRFFKPVKRTSFVEHLLPTLTPPEAFCEPTPAGEEPFSHVPENEYAFQDDLERLGVAPAARGERLPHETVPVAAYNTGADVLIPGVDLVDRDLEVDHLRAWPPGPAPTSVGAAVAAEAPLGGFLEEDPAAGGFERERGKFAGETGGWGEWEAYDDPPVPHPEQHIAQRALWGSHIRGKDECQSHMVRRREASWYARLKYDVRSMYAVQVAQMARELDPDERLGGTEFEAFKETGAVYTRFRPHLVTRAMYKLIEKDISGERPIDDFNNAKREAEKQQQRLNAISEYLHERELLMSKPRTRSHQPHPEEWMLEWKRRAAIEQRTIPVYARDQDPDIMKTQGLKTVEEIYTQLPRDRMPSGLLDDLVEECAPGERSDPALRPLPYLFEEDDDTHHIEMNRRGLGPKRWSGVAKNMEKYTQKETYKPGFFNYHAQIKVPTESGEATAWMCEEDPSGNSAGLWRIQLGIESSREEYEAQIDEEKRYLLEVIGMGPSKWIDESLVVTERRQDEKKAKEIQELEAKDLKLIEDRQPLRLEPAEAEKVSVQEGMEGGAAGEPFDDFTMMLEDTLDMGGDLQADADDSLGPDDWDLDG